MNPSIYHAANAYSTIHTTAEVDSATPHKLTLMLFDGTISGIRLARNQMERGQIPGKAESLSKAISLIDELNASLDHEVGGIISSNLSRLYDYCVGRLVHANAKNQVEPLNEVEALISGLRETWNQIRDQASAPVREEGGIRGNL